MSKPANDNQTRVWTLYDSPLYRKLTDIWWVNVHSLRDGVSGTLCQLVHRKELRKN